MSVTFASNGTTVEVRNPNVGNQDGAIRHQAMGLSAGGSRRVYDKGVSKRRVNLVFEELHESEKTELEAFLDDVANGTDETFTYTDHEGTAWTARLLSPDFQFVELADAVASSSTYTVGEATCPTTTREDGHWAIEIQLELEAT